MSISVRIDFGNRAFEVSGNREDVDRYLEKYSDLLEFFKGAPTSVGSSVATDQKVGPAQEAVPAEFGEYFHRFGSSVSDVDRVLIAGHFSQVHNGRGSFSTRDANELLINQNVKVANASECVRRALNSRRVFAVGKGEYKVSSQGIEYVQSLQGRTEV
jgi:hypothetical protein